MTPLAAWRALTVPKTRVRPKRQNKGKIKGKYQNKGKFPALCMALGGSKPLQTSFLATLDLRAEKTFFLKKIDKVGFTLEISQGQNLDFGQKYGDFEPLYEK